MRPKIGIVLMYEEADGKGEYKSGSNFVNIVRHLGGLPLFLPMLSLDEMQEALDGLDGLILTGGPDVDPQLFHELPLPQTGRIEPTRDRVEIAAAQYCYERDIPILGICRGAQVMAIAAGGTIYQDLATQVKGSFKHRQQAPGHYPTHPVQLVPGTKTSTIFGMDQLRVNSRHHQAVKDIPSGFTLTATSPDGVIEGIERQDHSFCVAVQWHPESMVEQHEEMWLLFSAFMTATRRTEVAR